MRAGFLEVYKRGAAVAADYLKEAIRGPAFAEGVRNYQQDREPSFDGVAHDPAVPTYTPQAG